jgi:hypothetical protein
LSWYSEWIDPFECGVRYRTVACRRLSGLRLAEQPAQVQRRLEHRQLLAELGQAIQSWSRKKCIRPVSVCHVFRCSTFTVNGAYRRPPVSLPDHSGW